MSANTIHELIKVHWNKSWNNLRNSINSFGSTKDNWQTLIRYSNKFLLKTQYSNDLEPNDQPHCLYGRQKKCLWL